jgi:LPXTG-site transpeptidase (sortase) family protein
MKNRRALDIANTILSATLFVLILYILLSPYTPYVVLSFQRWFDRTDGHVYQESFSLEPGIDQENLKPVPRENTLVIPEIHVDGKIHESDDPSVLEEGMWRRPQTSTPDQGGNTVIVAHRFLYTTGAHTFYHLDKLDQGDIVTVYWEETPYHYRITETDVVPPTATNIEEQTDEAMITLYTCTPLWTSEKRLVVRGELIEQ